MGEFESVTLRDPSSSLSACYVPAAGMICTSLADDGVEFLGQRRGLAAYVTNGKTMGIPILYPWANRLSASTYGINGAVVSLTVGTGGVRADEHGVPIHGVLAAYPGWLVTARSDNALAAVLDFGGRPSLLASFPFPHVLTQEITLADRTLTIETTVMPTTAASVPLCFGYHPYFQIPGVPRDEWTLTTPTMRRLPVDSAGLPTGESEDWTGATKPLKNVTYDDGFDNVPEGAVFTLEGGQPPDRGHLREGLWGSAIVRATKRRPRRHRADGGPHRRAASRKLPLRLCRQAGDDALLGDRDLAFLARLPDHQRGALGHDRDITALPGAQPVQLISHLGQPGLKRLDLVGQLDDPFDAGQVDTLVLGQPLHLAEEVDVALRVAAAAARTTLGAHQTESVIRAQRLRVHTRQLGGNRDEEGPRCLAVVGALACHHAPAHPARGSNPLARSAFA